MSGWLTNGLPNDADFSLSGNERITVDTQLPNGQNPQTAYVTLAQLGLGAAVTGIVAHAGGGQANATPLLPGVSLVTVVATAGDSVSLPLASLGLVCTVTNGGANSMQVFGAGTDTINGVATGTGVALAAGASAVYRCTVPAPGGNWIRFVAS